MKRKKEEYLNSQDNTENEVYLNSNVSLKDSCLSWPMSDIKSSRKAFKRPRIISDNCSTPALNNQIINTNIKYPGFLLASDKKIELSEVGKKKMLQIFQEFDLSDIPTNFDEKCEEEVKKDISSCINNDQDLLNSEDDIFISAIDFESIISESDVFL